MEIVDPERMRLVPGQSMHALFAQEPSGPGEIGLFVRALSGRGLYASSTGIQQRAGLIRFDDVLLVLTMIKVGRTDEELFDVWWNYHAPEGLACFRQMSEQERLTVHFYDDKGKSFSIVTENEFRKFFSDLGSLIAKTKPWTEVEFDRAVRGFCAQSYPKENLWQMIEFGSQIQETSGDPRKGSGIDDYQGSIPYDLRPFYTYVQQQGHCIRVIPSILADRASAGNPEDYLHAAPVKTVLRCGIRWVRGFPVAPIPYIPGHGLAVPPEDEEL